MSLYEVLVIGSPDGWHLKKLRQHTARVSDGLLLSGDDRVVLRTSDEADNRDPKAVAVALYFGGGSTVDRDLVRKLEAAKVPIIPVISEGQSLQSSIPQEILESNAFTIERGDTDLNSLAAVVFECLGLLHTQRRLFVSYRRKESRSVALQLFDELSQRGFDVFLDTHDIRPGEPFQEVLWHRLADSDVLIMLDTVGYFDSKWTVEEYGRSLAKGIHVLRLLWPDNSPDSITSISDTIQLTVGQFTLTGELDEATILDIASKAEQVRSRSIMTRHLEIVGKLKTEVERIGCRFESIGAHRAIRIVMPSGKAVWAYPAVGIPTALTLNDVATRASGRSDDALVCVVYDHIGIRSSWLSHLKWLDDQIVSVRSLRVFSAGWDLAAWEAKS